ncbi:MAG: hypothetical protein A2Z31_02590 [candidate division NC10 bacterium RBG_16_65_8]|nr:MAG: hypothetical protein A2Z31_02590 [candidate division NC10 bacterium RBG_16_65_8]
MLTDRSAADIAARRYSESRRNVAIQTIITTNRAKEKSCGRGFHASIKLSRRPNFSSIPDAEPARLL